jgi:hypothetical protein
MKGNEYSISLLTSVVIIEEYNVMVNSKEVMGTTEYFEAKDEMLLEVERAYWRKQ